MTRKWSRTGLALAAACLAGCAAAGPGGWPAGETTYGRQLLLRRCQSCHAVPAPAQYTRARWEAELAKMGRLFHMPAADWDTLLALVPPPPASVEPGTAGAR